MSLVASPSVTASIEQASFPPAARLAKLTRMIRLVLFDIDGTLISTGGAGMKAFDRAFELEFGVRQGARDINFAGRTDTGILHEFFARHRIAPREDNVARFFASYVHWLEHFLHHGNGRILPGVLSLLRDLNCLDRPPAIGLLTGNIRLGAQIKLRHYGLWEHFVTGAFGCEHADRNEVARTALARGRESLGGDLRGDEVLVVGDTTRDIDCARAIGARCLAVATGGDPLDQLQAHGAARVVPDLTQVAAGELGTANF